MVILARHLNFMSETYKKLAVHATNPGLLFMATQGTRWLQRRGRMPYLVSSISPEFTNKNLAKHDEIFGEAILNYL